MHQPTGFLLTACRHWGPLGQLPFNMQQPWAPGVRRVPATKLQLADNPQSGSDFPGWECLQSCSRRWAHTQVVPGPTLAVQGASVGECCTVFPCCNVPQLKCTLSFYRVWACVTERRLFPLLHPSELCLLQNPSPFRCHSNILLPEAPELTEWSLPLTLLALFYLPVCPAWHKLCCV